MLAKEEDREFYSKKGYIQIHSSIFGKEVYLVKSMQAHVPDKSLLRFDEDEIKYIKKLKKKNELSDEQLRVLTMAKETFGGNIIDADAKTNQAKHKRTTARQATRKRAQYKEPKKWNLKSQARPSV